jgi:antitoxin (DNA-binding transcriptional repressor) of toxin-antitoxin stability system
VRRAEAGDDIILTRHGRAAVRRVPVTTAVAADARRRLHRNTITRDPATPVVHWRLPPVARILVAAQALTGDADRAIVWFRHQPLPGHDGRTAQDLVEAGHADAALAWLEDLRDGQYAQAAGRLHRRRAAACGAGSGACSAHAGSTRHCRETALPALAAAGTRAACRHSIFQPTMAPPSPNICRAA